jgi:hypothetical protein
MAHCVLAPYRSTWPVKNKIILALLAEVAMYAQSYFEINMLPGRHRSSPSPAGDPHSKCAEFFLRHRGARGPFRADSDRGILRASAVHLTHSPISLIHRNGDQSWPINSRQSNTSFS